MPRRIDREDARYEALASPLKCAGKFIESNQEELLQEESDVLEGTTFRRIGSGPPRRGVKILRVGDHDIICGKTTPVHASNRSANFSCFLAMPFVGGFTTRDGALQDEVCPGDVYLNQDYYGRSTMGYLSSLFVALDRNRLHRTMGAISGGESLRSLGVSILIKGERRNGVVGSSKLWALISHIDQLHGEHPYLPSCLGLDEQFYRLLALGLLESAGRLESVERRWASGSAVWKGRLDDLVDFIRANTHTNLTLTDLEERSHYSARQLQYLFKEKLKCTPMQFVRRQRLLAAMEKLQTADWDASVGTIARDCGYRYTTRFSSDFFREFGVKPSTVLKASRPGRS